MEFRITNDHPEKGIPPQKRNRRLSVDECAVIADILPPKGLMIDVGAHFGGSLRHFLHKGWTVHAFEPCTATRQELESRMNSEERERCTIDARAISDTPAKGVSIFTSEQSSGITSLIPFHSTHTVGELVDVITLDEYLSNSGIEKVNFLKIDTEGNDLPVLKGLGLDKYAPEVVLCEFEDRKTLALRYGWRDLANYLVKSSYQVWVSEWHPIVKYGQPHEWCALKQYPCELEDPSSWGNLLAFRTALDDGYLVSHFRGRVSKRGITTQIKGVLAKNLGRFNRLRK